MTLEDLSSGRFEGRFGTDDFWNRWCLRESQEGKQWGDSQFDKHQPSKSVQVASMLINYFKQWRKNLPDTVTWTDEEPPSHDLRKAVLRAGYSLYLHVSLRPFLEVAYDTIDRTPIMNVLSGLLKQVVEVVREWVASTVHIIIAFDRVGTAPDSPYEGYRSTRTSPFCLNNVVSTLHA